MRRLRAIEGGGRGGLDPRRARLARVHDASILGLVGCIAAFGVVSFFLLTGNWSEGILFWAKLGLAVLGVASVMCVATIYMVAFAFDADPRTRREQREWEANQPPAR